MKVSLPFGFLFTVVILAISLLTACGRSPLVRPETSASQTEIAAETGEAISPVVPATKIPETPTSTPSPTATVQTPLVSEANASPSSEPTLTPTAKPLSPLDDRLETLVFSTVGEKGPEIWRMQVDEQGQKAGPAERVDLPTNPRMLILGLFPSPDGRRVAIGWIIDTGTTHVSILDVANGQLTPLFGQAKIDQRVTFLDWTPDSQSVLVLGGTVNPDLGNSAWLVDVNSHQYHDVNIKQVNEIPYIPDASFSPDGKMIVYAQDDGQIWQISVDGSGRHLLYENSQAKIENVLWSPDGNYIAFTQWVVDVGTFPSNAFGVGELHLMKTDGSKEHTLSPIVIHFDNQLFRPIWSSDSQKIAFVKNKTTESGKSLNELSNNLYLFNMLDEQINQLTNFENTQLIKPIWSPDDSQIAFLMNENRGTQFKAQTITVKGKIPKNLDVAEALPEIQSDKSQSANLDLHSFITWLP